MISSENGQNWSIFLFQHDTPAPRCSSARLGVGVHA